MDNMTAPIMSITNSLDRMINTFSNVKTAADLDNSSLQDMKNQIELANVAVKQVDQSMQLLSDSISENGNAQRGFNDQIKKGENNADSLLKKIMSVAGVYLSIRGIGKVMDWSDELANTTARLNMINDGMQTTQELQDKVFRSAQRSRASYQQTADVVGKLGIQAGEAFSSNDELIAFAEQLNKSFVVAGTSAQGIESTMYNLTQALSSGVLRGQDLYAVFSNAPQIVQNIADYMGVPIGQIRDMAAEGQLSAKIVKNAMLAAAEETNARFEQMPMTWSQIWTLMSNDLMKIIQPVLQLIGRAAKWFHDNLTPVISRITAQLIPLIMRLFEIIQNNMPQIEQVLQGITTAIEVVIQVIGKIIDVATAVYNFFVDNWSKISPIVYTIVGAIIAYEMWMKLSAIATGIVTAAKYAYIFALSIFNMTAAKAAAAQWGLNNAMYANPIGIIIALVVALAVAFVIFTEQIVGAIWWLGALFKNIGLWIANVGISVWNTIKNIGRWFENLGLAIWAIIQNIGFGIANFFLGIWEVVKAIASNIGTAFSNAWTWIQIQFWKMVDGIMQGLKSIAELANRVLGWMGINIDTSGLDFAKSRITDLSNKYGEMKDIGAAWAAGSSTFEYKSVGEAWRTNEINWFDDWAKGITTYDVFQKGWGSDAYNRGAEIGAEIHDKIMSVFDMFKFDTKEEPPPPDKEPPPWKDDGYLDEILNNTGNTADNTKRTADISEENLKYLRDIAERDTINRFTTAEVNIDFGGVTNNIGSDMDLDGVISYIADGTREALELVAEGVHA